MRSLLIFLSLVLTVTLVAPACQPAGEPEPPPEEEEAEEAAGMEEAESPEAALDILTEEFEEAWNAGDAAAIASHYTADADSSGPDGEIFTGRENVQARYAELMSGIYSGTTIAIEQTSVRWLDDDMALTNGTWTVSGMAEGTDIPNEGLYTNIVVKDGGSWKIASLRSWFPVKAPGTT